MSWSTLSRHISFLVLHLLTFLAIIHLQNQILSPITVTVKALAATSTSKTSEAVTTTIDFQFNEFNSTRTISTLSPPATTLTSSLRQPEDNKISLLSAELSSLPSMVLSKNAFLLPSSLTQSTATTAATSLPLQDRKLSVVMNSNQLLNVTARNSSIQPFNSTTVSTSTGNNSPKVSSIQYANSQTLDFMDTDDHVTLPFKSMKSISSKFPLELEQSKFVWTKSGNNMKEMLQDAVNSTAVTAGAQAATAAAAAAALRLVTEKPRILRINNNKHHHEHHWGPFFEEPLSSTASGDNIITTAHLFTEAVLNCRVGMLKDKTVMWVRRTADKVSLLTVGNVTYSSDPRIRVKFQYPNNWRLLINPTQWDDAGIYMCQVSTHPPRVFTTNLTIIEPPLRLIDEQERDVGDRYYKTGSTIDLQCQISRSFLHKEKQNILKSLMPLNMNATTASSAPSRNMKMLLKEKSSDEAPKVGSSYNDLFSSSNPMLQSGIPLEKQFSNMVFWAKDDEQLPTTAFRRISTDDKWFTSRTSITDAKLSDSGNYSCSIGRLFTAIVQVQVLTGESPAAVQHNSGCRVKTGVGSWQQLWKMYLTTALHMLKLSSYNN